MHPRLREAAEHLNAGRDGEAAAACEEVLRASPGDAAALHLSGVALSRLGRAGEALERLRQAVALAPASAPVRLALGNALQRAKELAPARDEYRQALALDPANAAARFQLGAASQALGDHAHAAASFGTVARANPLDFEATQRFVDCAATLARAHPAPRSVPADATPSPLASVAVGFCSIDDGKARRARETLARALAPAPCTFHVIRDARSLAEAFNRVLQAARADVVILCHDDIEVLTPRLDRVLASALEDADVVGVAGSDRVTGPAVLWTGHPHVHGWVSYLRDGQWEAAPLSLRAGLLTGMQALDGVFIALRGALANELRFDARTFDGFHFYDLDFTYRAWRDGLRLAVTTDALLVHESDGRFDDAWKLYAKRFGAKFPALDAAAGEPHWYGARFATRGELLAFYDRMRDAAAAPVTPA